LTLTVTVVLCLCMTVAGADEIDDRVDRLNELLKDLTTVVAERRADEIVVTGWTRNKESRKQLDKILAEEKQAIDQTGDDIADADRMVEMDVAIVVVTETVSRSVGFDFLNLVNLSFEAFASSHRRDGDGLDAPGHYGPVEIGVQQGNFFNAKVEYNVNIANATDQKVRIVARPHLTTLNGEKAEFLAGGEIVFKVSGLNSGRIQPYPFGIQLNMTPTVLRTPGPRGQTMVLMDVDASRLSVLGVALAGESTGMDDVVFDKVQVKSKALLPMNETLILSGLYQSEQREVFSGVPLIRRIPFIKYFFSNKSDVNEVMSTVILVTPREPGVLNEQNLKNLDWFIRRRARYIEAREKGGEVLEQFKRDYNDWYKPQPNRYATHFFLLKNSKIYAELRGEDLRTDKIRKDIMSVYNADEVRKRDEEQR